MARLMTRLSAGVATITLTVLGGAGPAAAAAAVDKQTGPVSYANPASLEVLSDDDPATKPARLVTETQRSPLGPGTSRLDQAQRSAVPEKGDETGIVPNYRIDLGKHKVVASLGEDHVPRAAAETDYTLDYLTPAGSSKRVLALTGARTAVACADANSLGGEASAAALRVLDANGGLEEVPLPRGDASVTRTGLPFGPAVDIDGMPDKEVSSDITISRVNSFDELLRQDQWRDGPGTAVSGWQVEIVTHITPSEQGRDTENSAKSGNSGKSGNSAKPEQGAESESATNSERSAKSESATKSEGGEADEASANAQRDAGTPEQQSGEAAARQPRKTPSADVASTEVRTRIVLGGVSCSIPSDFTPVSTGSGGGAAANNATNQADVPVAVPAGGHAWSSATGPAGYSLIGAGALAGITAVVLFGMARRRRAVVSHVANSDTTE